MKKKRSNLLSVVTLTVIVSVAVGALYDRLLPRMSCVATDLLERMFNHGNDPYPIGDPDSIDDFIHGKSKTLNGYDAAMKHD